MIVQARRWGVVLGVGTVLGILSGCGKGGDATDAEKNTFAKFQSGVTSFQFDTLFAVDVDGTVASEANSQTLITAIRKLKIAGTCKKEIAVNGATTTRKLTGAACPVVYISELTREAGQSVPSSGFLKVVLQSADMQALSDVYFLELRNALENGVLKMSGTVMSQSGGTVTFDGKLWTTATAVEYDVTFAFPGFQAQVRMTFGFDGKVSGTFNGERYTPATMTGILQ